MALTFTNELGNRIFVDVTHDEENRRVYLHVSGPDSEITCELTSEEAHQLKCCMIDEGI